MTAPRHQARPLGRREFLRRLAAVSAAATAAGLWAPGHREAWARTRDVVARPEGTTFERFIWFDGVGDLSRPGTYTPLRAYEPGWALEVRGELVEPKRGREDRRESLSAFLHVTDYQFPDVQSPARAEFLSRYADEPFVSLGESTGYGQEALILGSTWRPQEALVVHACEALHRRVHDLRVGPVTGRPLDFAISTGDNFDNKQANELRWFMTLMDGGRLAANSGAPDVMEGVQTFEGDAYDDWYYHPDPDLDRPPGAPERDYFKRNLGFPDRPGLLEAAIRPFQAASVGLPWFSTYGNHDQLIQGTVPVNQALEELAVGGEKLVHPAAGIPSPGAFARALSEGDPDALALYLSFPRQPVTPDAERAFIFDREYLQAHLDSPGEPTGHGYTEWHLDRAYLFYSFDLAADILGISLDTCAPALPQGSIGAAQLAWLEEELIAAHSRYYDRDGTEVRGGGDDRLVVVFGHHPISDLYPLQGPRQIGRADEPDAPDATAAADGYLYRHERQHGSDEVLELLHRFPNVIAYVNGHRHLNRVTPHTDPEGRSNGFWEITTSAQLAAPQHARIIEVTDNRDGTLSIFATLIDHAGAPETGNPGADADVLALAALSRELSFNSFQGTVETKVGAAADRNVELLLPAPFRLTPGAAPPGRTRGSDTPTPSKGSDTGPRTAAAGPVLPATGGGLAGLGATALAAAIALRERGVERRGPAGASE
jgi:metallophosphoesterase (TIGR03767 family)